MSRWRWHDRCVSEETVEETVRATARLSTLSSLHALLICVKYCNIRRLEHCIILRGWLVPVVLVNSDKRRNGQELA